MNYPIIFLDIDGVVNTLQINTSPYPTNTGKISREGFYFDLCDITDDRVSNIQAIMWLNKLCKETKAKIVISSSWRLFERDEHTTEKCLRNSGLLPEIDIIGATPYLSGEHRGQEIQKWLDDNHFNGQFIILDDDKDMDHLIEHLVWCDVYTGFGYQEYSKSLKLLNFTNA